MIPASPARGAWSRASLAPPRSSFACTSSAISLSACFELALAMALQQGRSYACSSRRRRPRRRHGNDDDSVIAAEALAPPRPPRDEDDPFAQLERCHRRLEERLEAFARAPGDAEEEERFFAFLDRSIRRHEDDEEASLFPRLAASAELAPVIASLREEHRAQAERQQKLREAKGAADKAQILSELAAGYRAHIEKEERALFPAAKRALDADATRALAHEMDARRGGAAVAVAVAARGEGGGGRGRRGEGDRGGGGGTQLPRSALHRASPRARSARWLFWRSMKASMCFSSTSSGTAPSSSTASWNVRRRTAVSSFGRRLRPQLLSA